MAKRIKLRLSRGCGVEMGTTLVLGVAVQLLTMFLLAINIHRLEQRENSQLPASVLARPPEGAVDSPVINRAGGGPLEDLMPAGGTADAPF